VPTPTTPSFPYTPFFRSNTAAEFYEGTNIGLGFRVPMVIASPWTRGGFVDSHLYDHTSVIRFMETWTAALGTPAVCGNISAWRRQVCGDLTNAFNFTSPVYGLPALPATSSVISQATADLMVNPSPGTNSMPTQEPGTKPARALVIKTKPMFMFMNMLFQKLVEPRPTMPAPGAEGFRVREEEQNFNHDE